MQLCHTAGGGPQSHQLLHIRSNLRGCVSPGPYCPPHRTAHLSAISNVPLTYQVRHSMYISCRQLRGSHDTQYSLFSLPYGSYNCLQLLARLNPSLSTHLIRLFHPSIPPLSAYSHQHAEHHYYGRYPTRAQQLGALVLYHQTNG